MSEASARPFSGKESAHLRRAETAVWELQFHSTVTTLTWGSSGDDESKYREEVIAPGRQDLLEANDPVFRSANLIVVQSMDSLSFVLGERELIAAIEYGVEGMRVGGRRRFRAGPHLGYRDVGVDGVIPPNAILIIDLKLLAVETDLS